MSAKETFMEEFKAMFAQYMQNEEKSRSKHHDKYSDKRNIYNRHYQRKERMCFEPKSSYYSIETEVHILYFDGNKNVEAYLEWETNLDQTFKKYKVDEYT